MIEPKYKPGDRVIVTVADDMFTGHSATIRSWKRRNKPRRILYILDIDGTPMKWGAGPYSEDELTKEPNRVNITQITVSYGETQSLPEYSNVKPNLTITAVLDQGDDPEAIEAALWTLAKSAVREQIDLALEANNIPAKWSDEPRYQVLKTRTSSYYDRGKVELPRLVAIIPNALKLDDRFVSAGYHDSRKLRSRHAQRLAAKTADDGYTIVDCSDGDLSKLLALLPEKVKAEEPAPAADTMSDEDHRGYKQADDEEYHEIDDDDDLDEDEE